MSTFQSFYPVTVFHFLPPEFQAVWSELDRHCHARELPGDSLCVHSESTANARWFMLAFGEKGHFFSTRRVLSVNKYLTTQNCSLKSVKGNDPNSFTLPTGQGQNHRVTEHQLRHWTVTLQSFFFNIWHWSAQQAEFLAHREISLVQLLFRHHSKKTLRRALEEKNDFLKKMFIRNAGTL